MIWAGAVKEFKALKSRTCESENFLVGMIAENVKDKIFKLVCMKDNRISQI